MTKGWSIYGQQLASAIQSNIVQKLEPIGQVRRLESNNYELGKIPNLHSLVPYSMDAKKPIFYCDGKDDLRGEHITRARDSKGHFSNMVKTLEAVIG